MPVIKLGAFARVGNFQRLSQRANTFIGVQIWSASQDNHFALPVVQTAQNQLIRVGVRHHLVHLRDDQLLRVPGDTFVFKFVFFAFWLGQTYQQNTVHFQTCHGEFAGDFFNTEPVQGNVIFNPA